MILIQLHILYYINIIFTDDLFEDDDDSESETVAEDTTAKVPKRKYLDEEWSLNKEDQKDFKGFPGQGESTGSTTPVDPATTVPCFALMYKFRREYLDVSVDAMVADHKGYCGGFKRLINSEVINMGKAKGVVLLWAGFTDDDKDDTKADIMTFLENDPLILKDVVEKWDLIDLEKSDTSTNLPPLKSTV